MSEYCIYRDELYHWGIKGQRWGVRRYQSKDGSLTEAGRKRYSKEAEAAKEALNDAKRNKKAASKVYYKAYNKYNLIPTNKNYKELMGASSKLRTASEIHKRAKLDYKATIDEPDNASKKSKHRLVLEEKYQKQGYTKEQASVMAKDRIRTEKLLVGVAALTVTACAVYATNKYIKDRTDQIIKSGDLLQRVEMKDTGGKLHDVFYASTGKHDNERYLGMLGFTRKQQTGHAFLMKLQTQGEVRVASKDKAVKAFGELYKNDPSFRDSVKDSVDSFRGKNKVNVNKLNNRNIRKMYDNFNASLIDIRESGSGADKKFYDKLKSAGYGAIQDINDVKFSGYHARNPLIIFDSAKKNITVQSVKELTHDDNLVGKAMVELGKGQLEGMGKFLTKPSTAVAVTGATAAMYVSDYSGNHRNKRTKRKR